MVWDQGPPEHAGAVVASPDYRRDASERLAALIAHLEDKFGDRTAGYHPCGQNTGEWFYQETWGPALNGYAAGDLRAWRRWLAERYPGDAALQAAWNEPQVTLAAAAVPTPDVRRAAPAGVLHDPAASRKLIDFAEFQQQMMADCVCSLARAAREASHGRKLVVFFYGYVFEFGAIRNGPATAGHYALRRVLDCPDIDVLCSPISYFDRGLGQSGPAMTAAESVALAGKMWLYEDDTRTYLGSGRFPGWADGVSTIEDTNRLLLRNTAQCALRNFGTWWMDLGATGWFDDPRMWAEMDRLKSLDEPLLARPLPFHPEVAAVIDERSMLRVAAGGQIVTVPGVYEVRRPLGRMGAPYGQYLQDDVLAGRVPAKMYVLLTSWRLSPQQRRELLAATRGRMRVWCYAPGYHEESRTALDAMQELTGFKIRPVSGQRAWAEPTNLGKQLGLLEGFGVKQPVTPLFAAADAAPEETLATWPDGSAAVALRQTRRWRVAVRRATWTHIATATTGSPAGGSSLVHTDRLQRLRQRSLPRASRRPGRPAGTRYRPRRRDRRSADRGASGPRSESHDAAEERRHTRPATRGMTSARSSDAYVKQLHGLIQQHVAKQGTLPKAAFFPENPASDPDSLAVVLGEDSLAQDKPPDSATTPSCPTDLRSSCPSNRPPNWRRTSRDLCLPSTCLSRRR